MQFFEIFCHCGTFGSPYSSETDVPTDELTKLRHSDQPAKQYAVQASRGAAINNSQGFVVVIGASASKG